MLLTKQIVTLGDLHDFLHSEAHGQLVHFVEQLSEAVEGCEIPADLNKSCSEKARFLVELMDSIQEATNSVFEGGKCLEMQPRR